MPVRIFKNQTFARWAKDEQVTDADLRLAAREIEDGLVDARLGGFLLKKRVARAGGGKSGGFRTIVAHRQGSKLFFIFGFSKNEQANITKKEKKALLKLGDEYMALKDQQLADLIKEKKVLEVDCNG